MRHVYLPVEHSENDLVLAGQVAEMLESASLYVTWGPDGYRQPDIEAVVREVEEAPAAPAPEPVVHGLLTEVLGTMAAFVAAMFAPRAAENRGGASA